MDPFTIMAAATAAFEGVKKAVELGREVEDIYGQLSTWAGHIGDFHRSVMEYERPRRPGLFDKIKFETSETKEAFDLYAAKQKAIDMEKEIYNMFVYGDLNHLGIDGYNEFRRLRQEVRAKREKLILDQMKAKVAFFENLKTYGLSAIIIVLGSAALWWLVTFAIDLGRASGKW